MIRHLRHTDIDKGQWDKLLLQCSDRLWYAQSWVLDLCCPQWEALIAEMCRLSRRLVVVDYPGTGGFNALTPMLFGMKKKLEGNTRTYRSFAKEELDREFGRHEFDRRATRKEFLLPMVLHRATGSARPLRWAEAAGQALGLTALAGSPIVGRFHRQERA